MKSKEEILKGYPWHGFEYSITREDALKAMQDYADQYATQLKDENAIFRKLIERAANANIGRPSELIEQFELFQKQCQQALSTVNQIKE